MKKYVISNNVAITCINECYIVLNLETSIYYTLENTAYVIFDSVNNGICTLEEISKNLCANYDVDISIAKKDTEDLLLQCIDHGLIGLVEGGCV